MFNFELSPHAQCLIRIEGDRKIPTNQARVAISTGRASHVVTSHYKFRNQHVEGLDDEQLCKLAIAQFAEENKARHRTSESDLKLDGSPWNGNLVNI